MTLGSGLPYQKTRYVTILGGASEQFFVGTARTPWQKNVDLRLQKNFLQLHGNSVGVTLSMFNVFNTQNLAYFDGRVCGGGPAIGDCNVNTNFGHAGGVSTDGRRIQFGATYSFK